MSDRLALSSTRIALPSLLHSSSHRSFLLPLVAPFLLTPIVPPHYNRSPRSPFISTSATPLLQPNSLLLNSRLPFILHPLTSHGIPQCLLYFAEKITLHRLAVRLGVRGSFGVLHLLHGFGLGGFAGLVAN
jgi:hypothetical protein